MVALAFNMDEANYLVVLAHGSSLRALSDAAGEHFEGLGVAARLLRKRKLLSNKLAKKLVRLDECAAILRHITKASCSALAHSIQEELTKLLIPGADEAGLDGSVFGDSVHDDIDQGDSVHVGFVHDSGSVVTAVHSVVTDRLTDNTTP